MDSSSAACLQAFDDWYASLPPLNASFDAPVASPSSRLSWAWQSYMDAVNWMKEVCGPGSPYRDTDNCLERANNYERQLIMSVPSQNEQLVMVCRAAFNHALVRLTLNHARGRKYAAIGYDLSRLTPDILEARKSVAVAHAELIYITDAMQAIALGMEPPFPPDLHLISSTLMRVVSSAAATKD